MVIEQSLARKDNRYLYTKLSLVPVAWQVLAVLSRGYRVRSAAVLLGLLKIALSQTHAIHQN